MSTSSPLRALRHYRELPALVGWTDLLIAAAARVPFSMVPLGTLTAVTAATGSVAQGGLATGIVSIVMATLTPVIGRWCDRAGQRRVLTLLVPVNAAAFCALIGVVLTGTTGPIEWLACTLLGATLIPVGSLTRARWVAMRPTPRVLAAAFSYESMADEFLFVIGPVLVGTLSVLAPWAPLALGAAITLLAGVPFALRAPAHVLDDPASADGATSRPSIGRVLRAVAPSILTMVCIGLVFGATQASTEARALALGAAGRAGLVYAVMGIGSATVALLVVLIPESITPRARVAVLATGAAAALALTAAQATLVGTALCLLLTGFMIGALMVTSFTTGETLAPEGGLSVAMTALAAAVTIGVASGSSLGGVVAQHFGSAAGIGVGACAMVVAALASPLLPGGRVRERRSVREAAAGNVGLRNHG